MKLSYLFPILILSCGSKETFVPQPTSTPISIQQTLSDLNLLVRVDHIAGFVSDLPNGVVDDGDSTIRNGQLCFSGEEQYCKFVKNAISPDGRIFRSPLRVGNENEDNSASRDQLLGVLLYLSKTHDTDTAKLILKYIESHNGYMCNGDSRCKVSNLGYVGGMWGMMRLVWNHLGLTPNLQMQMSNMGDETTLIATAKASPVNYQLHLIAMEVVIYRHCDKNTSKLNDVAHILAERDPNNTLYAWLDGKDATSEYLEKAPKTVAIRDQWGLQRDMSTYDSSRDNVGSWIMLGNMILNGIL